MADKHQDGLAQPLAPGSGDEAASSRSCPQHDPHAAAEADDTNDRAHTPPQKPKNVNLLDSKDEAISMLKTVGLSADAAREAVEATEDVFVRIDPVSWAEAAQIWLAAEQDHAAERAQMAQLMAASLAEAQERKAAVLPLAQQPEADLQRRFASSALLAMFNATAVGGALFQPPVREPLVSLLELERQCVRLWYPGPGTKTCFCEIGQKLTAAIPAAASAVSSPAAGPGNRQKRKRPPCSKAAAAAMGRAAAANGAASAAAADERSSSPEDAAPAHPPPDPAAVSAWADVLLEKVGFLRKELAWLPQTPGEMPPFLQPYAAPPSCKSTAGDGSGGVCEVADDSDSD